MDAAGEFLQFMACMISLEDMQKQSCKLLVDFQQHLEVCRRAPLQETSDVIAKVVAAAPSARLTRYLKAGGWHEDPARLVTVKSQVLLGELQSVVNRTSDLIQLEFDTQLETLMTLDPESDEDLENQQLLEPAWIDGRLHSSDYLHMMSLILSMVMEDFKMQEKIMNALGVDTPSEALQTYSLMWTLRPFVDDVVVEKALSWMKL